MVSRDLPAMTDRTRHSWKPARGRWLLAALGILSVGVGAVGTIVPGLPTTIFLIVASYCFARSCPWLETRLLRNRLFAPYMVWIDEGRPMPRRAKVVTIATMWTFVTASLVMLHAGQRLGPWVALVITGAAAAGTAAIAADLTTRLVRRAPTTP
jgi:uncharacterized protein